MQLCRSWVAISKDPLIGTNQEAMTFWSRVAQHFNKDIPGSKRTAGSLKARWGVLQKVINKFCGCVNQVKQHNQSGASLEDCLNRALHFFSKDQKVVFKHLCCYNILSKVLKWSAYINKNTRKSSEGEQEAPVVSLQKHQVASHLFHLPPPPMP